MRMGNTFGWIPLRMAIFGIKAHYMKQSPPLLSTSIVVYPILVLNCSCLWNATACFPRFLLSFPLDNHLLIRFCREVLIEYYIASSSEVVNMLPTTSVVFCFRVVNNPVSLSLTLLLCLIASPVKEDYKEWYMHMQPMVLQGKEKFDKSWWRAPRTTQLKCYSHFWGWKRPEVSEIGWNPC